MERVETSQTQLTCLESFYNECALNIGKCIKTIFCNSRFGEVLSELIVAPIVFVKSVYHYILGRVSVEKFHTNDLNPTDLKALKPHNVAIVYIHGCMANHGSWIHLSKKMKEAGIGPGFTIDLNGDAYPWTYDRSHNQYCQDIKKVNAKLDELRQRYVEANLPVPKFVIVGHSRGGALAQNVKDRDDVAKVISMGNPTIWHSPKVFDIEGKYDVFVKPDSRQNKTHRALYNTTHLGLLYNTRALDHVVSLCTAEAGA